MKKYSFFFFILLLSTLVTAKEETLSKTFDAKGIATIAIESKYGEIKIETWDKEEIAVDVYINAKSNKDQTVDKILSNVSVKFREKGESLAIKTEFGSFFSFMKLSNNLFRGGEFSIDYRIKAPANIILDIELNDGNIVLYSRDAAVKIKHSNGYISSQEINGNNILKLRDSFAKFAAVESLELDMKGGTLALGKVNKLIANTYNSGIHIDKADYFDGKSVRDKITIKEAKQVFITSSLSELTLEGMSEAAIITADYGSIALQKLAKEFEELKITAKGAAIAINMADTPAQFAISHHISTKVEIPDSMGLHMKFGETQKDFITTGTLGNPTAVNQILINCRGGKLSLQ